jgi:hypothetical protein
MMALLERIESGVRQGKHMYKVTMDNEETVKRALLDACKLALEYLEANAGEYGTQSRIVACRLAIIKAEKAWNK